MIMSTAENAGHEPWYKKGWGVLLIGLIFAAIAGLSYIGVYTLRFYRDIQLGEIPPEVSAKFTRGNIQAPTRLKQTLAYSLVNDPTFGNLDAPLRSEERR